VQVKRGQQLCKTCKQRAKGKEVSPTKSDDEYRLQCVMWNL